MAKRNYTAEQIISKLREVEVKISQGIDKFLNCLTGSFDIIAVPPDNQLKGECNN